VSWVSWVSCESWGMKLGECVKKLCICNIIVSLIIATCLSGCSCSEYNNYEYNENVKHTGKISIADLYNIQSLRQESNGRIFITENDKAVPYIIATNDYNGSGNYLILREYLLEQSMVYNISEGRCASYYEGSEIDVLLNTKFYNSLSDDIKGSIIDSKIEITDKESLGIGGKDTISIIRKVFLLSYTEVNGGPSRTNLKEGSIIPYFTDNTSRVAYYNNGKPGSWWLRTPNTADIDVVCGVNIDGAVGVGGIKGLDGEYLNGVRPAMCLGSSTEVFKQKNQLTGEIIYIK